MSDDKPKAADSAKRDALLFGVGFHRVHKDGHEEHVPVDEIFVHGGQAYLIWSNEHKAWWRAKRSGYTVRLEAAGRYSREEAISTCAWARDGWDGRGAPGEIPVLETDAIACAEKYAAAIGNGSKTARPTTSTEAGE